MKAFKNLGNLKIRIQIENDNTQDLEISSREIFVPSYRPRTRSTVTIWNLPDSVLVHILEGMHIRDILSFRSVHPNLRTVVDSYCSLWRHVSFAESWPNEKNVHHFKQASEKRNVEATIKLAVAYLYKEGLFKDDIWKPCEEAAKYLCLAEHLTPSTFPFFWIFIRPPWSLDGTCCKVQTFQHIKTLLDKWKNPDLTCGVALTLKLHRLSTQTESRQEEEKYFKMAVGQNSAAAIFFSMLEENLPVEPDKAKELERIRLLRQIASSNVLEAKLNLIKCYTQGQFGGISFQKAQEYVRDFFRSSKPSGIHITYSISGTSDISRYILVDWLVEVVGMKDFSAHTLYLAVSLFDRFLQVRKVPRSQVQLLGVAAMIISSRFLGFDILTIKEGAWITDNSYTYHDVVRMMGELVGALGGNIRVLTIQDYVKVLVSVSGDVGYSAMLIEYLAMLCLLQSEMGQYSPAEVAASCLLLSRLLLNHADLWTAQLQEWTGFSQDSLNLCSFHMYKKCFMEGSEVEYRGTQLRAVKSRYADPNRYSVSTIKVISLDEVGRRLGVTELVSHGKDSKAIRFRNSEELIMSPRRNMGADYRRLSSGLHKGQVDRINAATPPIKKAYKLDEGINGYDGDLEDEAEETFSDKSDSLYELNEDMEVSSLMDTSDESKDWDADVSLLEDDASKSFLEEDGLFNLMPKSVQRCETSKKIACLSSMCQSGTYVTCHSAKTSPPSYKSNCSCKSSYNLSTKLTPTVSGSSTSQLSSSPSCSSQASCSSESQPLFPVNSQNVRSCIPCGSIQTVPKVSRRSKLNVNVVEKDSVIVRNGNASCGISQSSFMVGCSKEVLSKSKKQETSIGSIMSEGKVSHGRFFISTKSLSHKHSSLSGSILHQSSLSSSLSSKTSSTTKPRQGFKIKCNEFIPVSCDSIQTKVCQYLSAKCQKGDPHEGSSHGSAPIRFSNRYSVCDYSMAGSSQEDDSPSLPATPEFVPNFFIKGNGPLGIESSQCSFKKARLDLKGDVAFRKSWPILESHRCDILNAQANFTCHILPPDQKGHIDNSIFLRKRKYN